MNKYIFVLIVCAVVFLICFLIDTLFKVIFPKSKLEKSKQVVRPPRKSAVAKSFPLDADGKPIKGIPRHPILEDNVIVYSNATILGRITIGSDATVGGNIWVTENIPAGAKIVQTKAKK